MALETKKISKSVSVKVDFVCSWLVSLDLIIKYNEGPEVHDFYCNHQSLKFSAIHIFVIN